MRLPGDIHITGHTLYLRLDPATAARQSRAIAGLCHELTATQTRYPAPTSKSNTASKATTPHKGSHYVRSPGAAENAPGVYPKEAPFVRLWGLSGLKLEWKIFFHPARGV